MYHQNVCYINARILRYNIPNFEVKKFKFIFISGLWFFYWNPMLWKLSIKRADWRLLQCDFLWGSLCIHSMLAGLTTHSIIVIKVDCWEWCRSHAPLDLTLHRIVDLNLLLEGTEPSSWLQKAWYHRIIYKYIEETQI